MGQARPGADLVVWIASATGRVLISTPTTGRIGDRRLGRPNNRVGRLQQKGPSCRGKYPRPRWRIRDILPALGIGAQQCAW